MTIPEFFGRFFDNATGFTVLVESVNNHKLGNFLRLFFLKGLFLFLLKEIDLAVFIKLFLIISLISNMFNNNANNNNPTKKDL